MFEKLKAQILPLSAKKVEKILFCLLAAAVIFIGLFLRLKIYFFNQGLWGDEVAIADNLLERNYLELFKPLNCNQAAPPFFLCLTKIFFDIGKNTGNIDLFGLFARFVPLVSSLISIPLFYLIIKKITDNKIFIITSLLLFCYNPVAINYAQELKQYSTELLFSCILILTFLNLDLKKDSKLKLWGYSILFCVSPWFSFYSMFSLAAIFSVSLFSFIKERKFNKNFLIIFIPFLISFSLFYFGFYKPVSAAHLNFMQEFWDNRAHQFLSNGFSEVFSNLLDSMMQMFKNNVWYLFTITLGFLILAIKRLNKISFFIFIVLALSILASYLGFLPFMDRLCLFLLPLFVICFSSFVFLIKEDKLSFLIFFILAVFSTAIQFEHSIQHRILHRTFSKEQFKTINNDVCNIDAVYSYDSFKLYSKINKDSTKNVKITFVADINKLEEEINKSNRGEIHAYILSSLAGIGEHRSDEIKEFLLNNKKIKVLETIYPDKKDTHYYIIKFMIK